MDPRLAQAMREGRRDVLVDVRERMRQGHIWTINGQSVMGHEHAPLLTLARGRSYIFEVRNDTAWHHPMHLHGMAFEVLSRDGTAAQRRERRDTVLLAPRERVEIAFVADEPGDWMLHCHILEHQESGMMGTIRVV
jgi:FtsP/CotA-like multicopper oxidase with cupredoxin domain